MGFLSNIKAGLDAAREASTGPGVDPASTIPVFVKPWPQDEVDRLLAGTGTIRAIVFGKRHQLLEGNERGGSMTVHVRLRPRGPAGTLGDEVTVKAKMSSWNAELLVQGLDIPVERDVSGAITQVASKQLADELDAKGNSGWTVDTDIEGMVDVARAVFAKPAASSPAPASVDDPRRKPVDRITWEIYVAVCAHLAVNGAPNGDDAEAQKFGVLPYTWNAVSSVWRGRVAADAELTELFDHDLAAAIEALG